MARYIDPARLDFLTFDFLCSDEINYDEIKKWQVRNTEPSPKLKMFF